MGIQIKDIVTGKMTNATLADTVAWSGITGKPETFPPTTHTHNYLPLSGGSLSGPLSISAGSWNNQLKLTRTSNGSNWGPAISFYDEKGGRGAIYMNNNNLYVTNVAGSSSTAVSLDGHTHDSYASKTHTHTTTDITDFPTKLSQFTNDACLPLGGGNLSGMVKIVRSNAGVDAMYYSERTDLNFRIGFGIGTSANRGIYDTKLGWVLQIDPSNNAAFHGTADYATEADKLDGKHASDFAVAGHNHDDKYAPKSHSHNYIVDGASSIELNNNSSLANYGGFIDFHFHKKDANDGNKIKPTNTVGTIVATIPDYTSRIIEDAPGRISVNGTKFTQDSNGKTYVAADYFKGTADKAIDSDKLDGKHASDFAVAGHTHDDRTFVTLVPTGTAIPANADLKTTQYLKVGRYYCSATANAKTLANCPVDAAFMMEVYSPLSTTLDNEDTAKYVYRLRKITHYSTGVQYVQYIGSGSTPGAFTYGSWYAIPQVSVTMDSSDTNGSSCAKGSATKPVYINAAGQFVECNSYPAIPTTLPANGGNADTVDNKHASDFATANHTTPVYTACTSSTDGTGGHIPAPVAGQQHQLLSGGYNWATLGVRNSSTPYKMYLTFTDSAGNRTDISNCTLNAPVVATDKNGLCPVLPNDTSLFLRGDGQWAAPPKQTVGGGTTTDTDTKNTAGATESASKLFLVGAPTQTASSVTYSNSLCYATDGYLYSNNKKVSVEGHNHNSSYLGWNRGALNVNKLYDGGLYMIASGSNLPFGSQYAQVLNLPYRNLTGNVKPDFGAQIALPNGDDASKPNSMFFRTSLSDTWNAWQEVSVVGHKHTKSEITNFSHTHTKSEITNFAHTHTVTGTATSNGAHTHTVTGTVASNGAHTHTVTGSVSLAGAHTHTVTGSVSLSGSLSGTCLTINASITSGTAASAGAHDHTLSGGTAASAGAHGHTFSSGSAASAGAHTHNVSGSASKIA